MPAPGTCNQGWEALRADPLPWLLEGYRPELQWRVLVELVRRPPTSPAVERARGAAGAAEPVASLLKDLHPDGRWAVSGAFWRRYQGPGWRMAAAVQLGADPADPRLQAAAQRLLEESVGEGGFAPRVGAALSAVLTARMVAMLAVLGWCRHPRVQEALAWLSDDGRAWRGSWWQRAITAVGVLAALTEGGELDRRDLRRRATGEIEAVLAVTEGRRLGRFGHPNLARTDLAEMLWALARADAPLTASSRPSVLALQEAQDTMARWRRRAVVAPSLPMPRPEGAAAGASRWITLHATVALLRYAVEAELPRLAPRLES